MNGVHLSTHVLDTARGRPAAGVPVRWQVLAGGTAWTTVGSATTDADGRVGPDAWTPPRGPDGPAPEPPEGPAPDDAAPEGRHRLVFDVEAWAGGDETFFPEVIVTFSAAAGTRHHVPLLLSPFAYSTYRGS